MVNQSAGGISELNGALLTALNQKLSGPFSPEDAAKVLSLTLERTRKFLAYLAAKGWLTRVRRGLWREFPRTNRRRLLHHPSGCRCP